LRKASPVTGINRPKVVVVVADPWLLLPSEMGSDQTADPFHHFHLDQVSVPIFFLLLLVVVCS
jgi:hypothetical protein